MKTDKTRNFTEGLILGPFLSFAIPVLFALFHIGLATPCSTLVQIVLCFICMFYLTKKLKKA